MVSPDWSQPLELMCDASDFAVGAVLEQREGKHFRPIHFASKTLNNAQQNYTVTEKELLAIILLLQELDIEIKNKKGAENVAADHLSRLENPYMEELRDGDIDDNFPNETLINVSSTKEDKIPWFKALKLKSKWYGPFMVKHGFPSGYVELYDKHGGSFIVNGHRVKLYHDEEQINELTTEEIHLMCEQRKMKAIPFMAPFPADYFETMPWVA
ncbi:reverse transcriptase domain-containing protein [Tanacetum coccineum]